jgi:hypothetical protein
MTKKKFIPLLLLLPLLLAPPAGAIQLGDTRAQVEALHDTAPVGDRPKGIAIYRWDLWKLEIQYDNDVIWSLTYTKIDPMTDNEIEAILDQNGGFASWHTTKVVKNRVWSWTRTDGATASMNDDNHNRVIELDGGRFLDTGTPPSPASISLVAVPLRPGFVSQPAPQPALEPAAAAARTAAAATPVKAALVKATAAPAPDPAAQVVVGKKEVDSTKAYVHLLSFLPHSFDMERIVMVAFALFGAVMIILGMIFRSRA